MIPDAFYIALASFFGATLIIVYYFRETGTKLEVRTNSVIEGKRKIIIESYLELIEEIIKRFNTQRNLSDEQEEKLEQIAYTRFALNDFPSGLSKVVDKLTFSFAYGIASVIAIISFPYIPTIFPDVNVYIWFQIAVGVGIVSFVWRYLFDGLFSISSIRKFEKSVNEIERSRTFDQLLEILMR